MKYIEYIPDIQLEDITGTPIKKSDDTQQTLSQIDFLLSRLQDHEFTRDAEGIVILIKLKSLFKKDNKERIPVEDTDWERLCNSVRKPSTPYNPLIAHQLGDYIDSVLKAKSGLV